MVKTYTNPEKKLYNVTLRFEKSFEEHPPGVQIKMI